MMTRQGGARFPWSDSRACSGGSRQTRHVGKSRMVVTIGTTVRGAAAIPERAEIARIAVGQRHDPSVRSATVNLPSIGSWSEK